MQNLKSYQEVINHLTKQKRKAHLLLGNGFSVAYDNSIFSYNALNNQIQEKEDKDLKDIFNVLKTQNFEVVMKNLGNCAEINSALGADEKLVERVKNISMRLEEQLLKSITKLHPEQVFNVPADKCDACAKFLNYFIQNGGNVFSTNYDLLLYWVLMRCKIEKGIDGFGRELENSESDGYIEEEDMIWSELLWGKNIDRQNIHYLHGALPLFDKGSYILKEQYSNNPNKTGESWILDKIKKRIRDKEYPVFVTAGDAEQKLDHIRHNQYLSFCYDRLCDIGGSLIVFGFSFGDFDSHIIDAINVSATTIKENRGKNEGKLYSIYIGIFNDSDYEHIMSIKSKFKCKVNLFDARTVNVWGK